MEKRVYRGSEGEMNDLGYQYYEARIEAIYDAIMSKLDQADSVYFSASKDDKRVQKDYRTIKLNGLCSTTEVETQLVPEVENNH